MKAFLTTGFTNYEPSDLLIIRTNTAQGGHTARARAALTRVPLGAVQALLGSRLYRPAPLHKKLLSQGVAQPAQRVGDGAALRAAKALSLAQEVALGKGETRAENSTQGKAHHQGPGLQAAEQQR